MAKLIFFCGKMAAGKSTLARQLADRENAVLMIQDQLLDTLFPGLVLNVASYLEYAGRINRVVATQAAAIRWSSMAPRAEMQWPSTQPASPRPR